MPVIVLATSGRDVLIAQGGKWLVDTTPYKQVIYSSQKLRGFPNTPEGRDLAVKEAIKRSGKLGKDIRFTPLEWKDDKEGPRYSTRFLVSDPLNPPGFIKGTYPDSKYPNESPEQAARREFKEETGYSLDGLKLTENAPGIFRVEIPINQTSKIIETWRNMALQTELYELRWEPMPDIRKDILKLNPQSQEAVPYLPQYYAGRRKTRRRKNGKRTRRR